MKIGCIQMNMGFGKVEQKYERADALIRQAERKGVGIMVLS